MSVEREEITVEKARMYLLGTCDGDEAAEDKLALIGAHVMAGGDLVKSDFSLWFDADGRLQRGARVLHAIHILQRPLVLPVVRGIPTDWDLARLDISRLAAQVSRWFRDGSATRISIPVNKAA